MASSLCCLPVLKPGFGADGSAPLLSESVHCLAPGSFGSFD